MCRVPVHPRQVGVWFRIWVGGVLLRISWMAACVNLSRKGQHRLAFLPPWTRQLVIVSICQADGPLSLVVTRAHTQKWLAHLKPFCNSIEEMKFMILCCFGKTPASSQNGVYFWSYGIKESFATTVLATDLKLSRPISSQDERRWPFQRTACLILHSEMSNHCQTI